MQKDFVIRNQKGLHMRAAAELMKLATRFKCDVFLKKGSSEVNVKSIMGLMGLAAGPGTPITLITRGKDEAAAMEALGALIDNKFGEE